MLSDGFEKKNHFVKSYFEREKGFEEVIFQTRGVKILASILMMLALWLILGSVVNAGTIPCITEWTIPVDADGVSGDVLSGDVISGPATTIKLPLPSNAANSYTVDWAMEQ